MSPACVGVFCCCCRSYLASEHACTLNKALSSLTARQRKVLRSALEPCRSLEAGEALWTAGQACTHAFLLSAGSATISSASATGGSGDSYRASYVVPTPTRAYHRPDLMWVVCLRVPCVCVCFVCVLLWLPQVRGGGAVR